MTKEATTIRLSPEAKSALKRLAQRESRSMASYLEWLIRREAHQAGCWVPNQKGIKAVSE